MFELNEVTVLNTHNVPFIRLNILLTVELWFGLPVSFVCRNSRLPLLLFVVSHLVVLSFTGQTLTADTRERKIRHEQRLAINEPFSAIVQKIQYCWS